MKRTPLIEHHRELNAKLVDFAGWEMPIQYSGVVDEYSAVRTAVGLFDVSHMGRVMVEGRDAIAFLQQITTNNVTKLPSGSAQYSMICNSDGGIKDDIFMYRLGEGRVLLCVNASNREKILSWLFQKSPQGDIRLGETSHEMAQIALQGPRSQPVLHSLCADAVEKLKPRQCLEADVLKIHCIISRTGYTGEVGYELYVPAQSSGIIWAALLEAGKAFGIKPCGLGARDLLRLDVGYLLYGNDMDELTTPLEAGAEWVVDFEKGDFIGRRALFEQKQRGLSRKMVGFELTQKAVPRHGMKILSQGGDVKEIGVVTSGNLSPRLQKGIGLAYVPPEYTTVGTKILVDIRGHAHEASVVSLPFYKRG
jgi:aminomethyltransferase